MPDRAARSQCRGVSGRYDDSDAALYRQVDIREVDELLADGVRQFVRDGAKIKHLLLRVRSTLVAAHETVRSQRRQIEEQGQYLARVGTPTTLNPLDALKYLDDEQKERIFDRISRERLQTMRSLVQRAQQERETLSGELETVRDVARALSQMAELPPHVRADVTKMLASLPTEPAVVHSPGMLDYPEPEPLPQQAPAAVLPEPAAPAPIAAPTPSPAPEVASEAHDEPDPAPPGPAVFRDPYGKQPTPQRPRFVDPYAPTATATRPDGDTP